MAVCFRLSHFFNFIFIYIFLSSLFFSLLLSFSLFLSLSISNVQKEILLALCTFSAELLRGEIWVTAAKKTFVIAEDNRDGFCRKHQEHGCNGHDQFFQLLDCDNDGKASSLLVSFVTYLATVFQYLDFNGGHMWSFPKQELLGFLLLLKGCMLRLCLWKGCLGTHLSPTWWCLGTHDAGHVSHLSPTCFPLLMPWNAWCPTCSPFVSHMSLACFPCADALERRLVSHLFPMCLPLTCFPLADALGRMMPDLPPMCLPFVSC